MRSLPLLLVVLALVCFGWWWTVGGEDGAVDAAVPGPDAAAGPDADPARLLLSEAAPDAPGERQPFAPGSRDGTHALAAAPQVLEGRVVDVEGRPVSAAQIRVLDDHVLFPSPIRPRGGSAFASGPFHTSVWSDDAGRFGFEFTTEAETVEIEVIATGYRTSPPRAVPPDAKDLTIVLEPAGQIRGELLLDEGVPHNLFSLVVTDERGREAGRTHRFLADGNFAWTSLEPGSYRVWVYMYHGGSRSTLLTAVDDVPASRSADGTWPDPLVIDLRSRRFGTVVHALDPERRPLAEFGVLWVPHGESPQQRAPVVARDGRIEIFPPPQDLDVYVSAEGFLTQRVEHVRAEETVVLERCFTVRVALADPACVPAPPARLRAKLYPLADHITWRPLVAYFDETGVATFTPPGAGTYVLQLAVVEDRNGRPASERVPEVVERVAIHDRMKQPHPLPLSPAAVEAALERLRGAE